MRYEPVGKETNALMTSIRNEYFEDLNNVNFELVYDTKRRVKNGKISFYSVKKADDLLQYFSENSVDYVIFLDKNVWDVIDEGDKKRILRRSMRHVFIDARNEDVKYKLVSEDYSDFKAEISINNADGQADWYERVMLVAESLYDKDSDEDE